MVGSGPASYQGVECVEEAEGGRPTSDGGIVAEDSLRSMGLRMVLWLEGLGKLEFEFELIERASLACKRGFTSKRGSLLS